MNLCKQERQFAKQAHCNNENPNFSLGCTYADFVGDLQEAQKDKQCRFAIFDAEYKSTKGTDTIKNKICFFYWYVPFSFCDLLWNKTGCLEVWNCHQNSNFLAERDEVVVQDPPSGSEPPPPPTTLGPGPPSCLARHNIVTWRWWTAGGARPSRWRSVLVRLRWKAFLGPIGVVRPVVTTSLSLLARLRWVALPMWWISSWKRVCPLCKQGRKNGFRFQNVWPKGRVGLKAEVACSSHAHVLLAIITIVGDTPTPYPTWAGPPAQVGPLPHQQGRNHVWKCELGGL